MELWRVVILTVLLSPVPPDPTPGDVPPEAMQALKDVCICLDLWDSQDGWGSFATEIRWAWDTRQACLDLPPSSDKWRWPSEEVCRGLLAFNCDVQTWLAHRSWDARADDASAELRRLHCIWDAVRSAQSAPTPRQRREALGQLRSLIGPASYHLGRLPGHVPGWMFAEVE